MSVPDPLKQVETEPKTYCARADKVENLGERNEIDRLVTDQLGQ